MDKVFLLDGKAYSTEVEEGSLERSFAVTGSEQSGHTTDYAMDRDVVETFYNYTTKIYPKTGDLTSYDAFYNIISDPNYASHEMTSPYGRETLTFQAYVNQGKDKLRIRSGKSIWGMDGLSLNFTAMEPRKRRQEVKWDIRIETNGQQLYSSVDDLTSYEQNTPLYAYCLPRYAKMDGAYSNMPDVLEHGRNEYISTTLSDQDGDLGVSPVITVTFNRLKTSSGVSVVFNRISEDYTSRLKIAWYKDTELIQKQELAPNGVEYSCLAKIPLSNQLVITLLKANQPYRYLWLSMLKNQRMTNADGLRVVYDGITPGAADGHTAATNNKNYYVDSQDLKVGVEFPDYALCLSRYAKMDGGYSNAPGTLDDMGYVSSSISDADRRFAAPPALTFTLGQNHSSVGITLTFNDCSEDYCNGTNIKWYRDDILLANQNYYPDIYNYFCCGIMDYHNKVVVTFLETNKPYRSVFPAGIIWGLVHIFKGGEIEDINCLMGLDPVSGEVSINTMDYTIRSRSKYTLEFQEEQEQTLYFDEAILDILYLKNGRQLGGKRYSVETRDTVGILDNNQFMGGIYSNTLVSDILDGIIDGKGVIYFLDNAYVNTTVSGYLPICTKRAALQQLAFAIGALVDTNYDRQLYIYPQQTEVTGEFMTRDIFLGLTLKHGDIVTGIWLYAHSYTTGAGSAQLYKGSFIGTAKVRFSEPYHGLSITGGTLGDHGANYAYITGTGGKVVLTKIKYNRSTASILKENPKITQNKNIVKVKEATLVIGNNAQAVLDRIYDYYSNNGSISFRAVIDDQELGNRANTVTGIKGTMARNVTKLGFKFGRRKVMAEVTVR